jgi:hypothetical protein
MDSVLECQWSRDQPSLVNRQPSTRPLILFILCILVKTAGLLSVPFRAFALSRFRVLNLPGRLPRSAITPPRPSVGGAPVRRQRNHCDGVQLFRPPDASCLMGDDPAHHDQRRAGSGLFHGAAGQAS